jgi:hypothetical protein
LPLAQIGLEALAPLLDPLSARRTELPTGRRGTRERVRHLLEGIPKDVVEQVCRALERRHSDVVSRMCPWVAQGAPRPA